jgi:hypothetical protein
MLGIAAALGLQTPGCHGYPRGVVGVTGSARVGGFLVGGERAGCAPRPVEDSTGGWSDSGMAQGRVGLDIARASEGAR